MLRLSARRPPVRIALLLVVLLVWAPPRAHALTKAIWGPVYRQGVNQFPLYHKLGVGIYQIALNWAQTAPTKPASPTNPADPTYRWPSEIGQAIGQARRFHMRVLIQIIGAPGWANGGHAWNWAPRHPSDYAAFARAAARHYRSVHLWMIWGEPTKPSDFQPLVAARPGHRLNRKQQAAPHLYARMLDGAYGTLKALSHSNVVIGGCTYTTGALDPLQWIQNLRLPNGHRPRMDMYAHNPFGETDPNFSAPPSPFDEVQFSDLPELAKWIDKYLHRGLPLFLSEWTIPTAPDQEFNFYVDPNVAAKWVRDAFRISHKWHRIYALGWVNVYDDPPRTNGGLLTVDGKHKPDFAAFQHG